MEKHYKSAAPGTSEDRPRPAPAGLAATGLAQGPALHRPHRGRCRDATIHRAALTLGLDALRDLDELSGSNFTVSDLNLAAEQVSLMFNAIERFRLYLDAMKSVAGERGSRINYQSAASNEHKWPLYF